MQNKKIHKLFVALFLSSSIVARAEDCPKSDPWDPVTKMDTGDFAGECVVSDSQRPVTLLERANADQGSLKKGDLLIANLRHGSDFWIAQIPAKAVEEVIFETQKIQGFEDLAHVRVHFKLRSPAKLLWKQSDGPISRDEMLLLSEEAVELRDIYFSAESGRTTSTRNEAWDPKADSDNYPLVMRFFTQGALDIESHQGALAGSYPINIDRYLKDGEKREELLQKIFESYLLSSHKKAFRESYHIAIRNCSIESLRIVDSVLSDRYPSDLGLQRRVNLILDAIPNIVGDRLRYRKLFE